MKQGKLTTALLIVSAASQLLIAASMWTFYIKGINQAFEQGKQSGAQMVFSKLDCENDFIVDTPKGKLIYRPACELNNAE